MSGFDPIFHISQSEQGFLQSYMPIFEDEKQFAEQEYQGGLGAMITSLRHAIQRQDQVRGLPKRECETTEVTPLSAKQTALYHNF